MLPVVDHFAFVARIYDRIIPSPDPERLERLLKLPLQGAMLDAGGGTGRVAERFVSRVSQLVVSDLSFAMLRQAGRKPGLVPLLAHAERLPFPDESFDRVLVVDALHHFCSQKEALRDLIRVLKPGGRMVIEEPDIQRPVVKWVALAEKLMLMGSRFHPSDRISGWLRSPGVSVRSETDGRFVFWLVVDKNW